MSNFKRGLIWSFPLLRVKIAVGIQNRSSAPILLGTSSFFVKTLYSKIIYLIKYFYSTVVKFLTVFHLISSTRSAGSLNWGPRNGPKYLTMQMFDLSWKKICSSQQNWSHFTILYIICYVIRPGIFMPNSKVFISTILKPTKCLRKHYLKNVV